MGKIRAKIDYLLKHNRFFHGLFYVFGSLFFKFLGLFIPIKKNRILFTAHGRLYNDSPRAIYEFLINHKEYDDYELFWGLETPNDIVIPGRAKKVKIDTLRYFALALSSKYWVTCVNIERGLKFKKKECIYLNTWHGTPIKSIGETKGRKKDNFSYISLFCTCGDYEKRIFKDAFSIKDDSFIYSGLPRNDELYSYSEKDVARLKRQIGVDPKKKVVLYAPTWRDSTDGGDSYNLKPPIDFKKWKDILGDKFVILLRLHPYTTKLLNVIFDDFVMDFSKYKNVNDLLIISDLLVSDYSAIIFDYAITEKPLICFGYDYSNYKNTRGFALDLYNEIPNGVIADEDLLLEKIKSLSSLTHDPSVKAFKEKYLEYGGSATTQCVHRLLQYDAKRTKDIK